MWSRRRWLAIPGSPTRAGPGRPHQVAVIGLSHSPFIGVLDRHDGFIADRQVKGVRQVEKVECPPARATCTSASMSLIGSENAKLVDIPEEEEIGRSQ